MNFFKSVFSDDTDPSDQHNAQPPSQSEHHQEEAEEEEEEEDYNPNPNPNPVPSLSAVTTAWRFGGLMKTLASRSEAVIETYRRDLEEFGTGLKKETAVIREVASRAVKDLPGSLEVGASVAQESLESVGQAIDNLGSSVWRGTADIISHGKDTLLAVDQDTDSSSDNNNNNDSNQRFSNQGLSSNRYSRFDAQLRSIQCDENTYCEEPEDLADYNEWKLGFVIDEKGGEIESLLEENGVVEGIYRKLVPGTVDRESFWSRYFYKLYKLKQAEDARAKLVKRAISGEEEDLSWDVDDDDDDDVEESNVVGSKGNLVRNKELEDKNIEIPQVGTVETGEKSLKIENSDKGIVAESIMDKGSDEKLHLEEKSDLSEVNSDKSEAKFDEKMVVEGKTDHAESCKDSDISIVSSQPSLPEEEDLGWDEIEDIGSNDENKGSGSGSGNGSPNKVDLRKRLSAAEEDEDLNWDIEDDDEPVKS
ncbi:hypothetical protein L1049_017172 [Liquidambar formosana]|uniref:BSD domain-containing protein n=1 Tax=Liquidambar formosana TaxID=63359 RepID=A0AAP0S7P3_LIQFO